MEKKKSNLTLWLILAICVLPFVSAVGLFFYWTPNQLVNYGDLVDPKPLPDFFNKHSDKVEELMHASRGKWLLLIVDSGNCNSICQKKLYWLRQIRLAQGREMERVGRVWLINDLAQPSDELLGQFVGTELIRLADEDLLFTGVDNTPPEKNLFLVDPLGNLMMRYSIDSDPNKLKKDLKKLLKVSKAIKYRGDR